MYDKTYEDRLRYLRLWTLEERRNRQDLIEVFKMYRGHSAVSRDKLFVLDINRKGTRWHTCKLVKTRCTRDVTKYFLSQKRLSTGGICWTKGRRRHPASTLLNLDWAISGTTGWASLWISPLSPRPFWFHRLPVRLHKVNHKTSPEMLGPYHFWLLSAISASCTAVHPSNYNNYCCVRASVSFSNNRHVHFSFLEYCQWSLSLLSCVGIGAKV